MGKWAVSIALSAAVLISGLMMGRHLVTAMTATVTKETHEVVQVHQPDELVASTVPALTSVDDIADALPATMSGLNVAATAESRPVENTCVTPVVSRTKAWAGGNWMTPSGVVVTISVFPAGSGKLASGCTDAVTVRHGDIVAFISERRATVDMKAVKAAMQAGIAQCADPSMTEDQTSRNPLFSNYQGWNKVVSVTYEGDAPQLVNDLVAAEIELPSTPKFPHLPESLPSAPDKPVSVVAPSLPTLTASLSIRVPDDVGPGCGWAFTGSAQPHEDVDSLNKAAADAIAKKKAEINASVETYRSTLDDYNQKKLAFDEANSAWEKYRDEVAAVESKWADQRRDWNRYQNKLDEYNSAVKRRDNFITRKNEAATQYESDIQWCQVIDPPVQPPVVTTTPEPVETTGPDGQPVITTSEPVVTTPEPEPAPPRICPERPAILDQQPPHVPDMPSRPVLR